MLSHKKNYTNNDTPSVLPLATPQWSGESVSPLQEGGMLESPRPLASDEVHLGSVC